MQIRRRSEADLDQLVDLAAEVHVADGYPIHLPDDDYRAFLTRPQPLDAWVAAEADQILGHVALNATTSRPVMDLVQAVAPTGAPAFVARLLVDPAHRRRRVGRRLLDHVHAHARRVRRTLFLDVVDIPSAHGAISMYRSADWSEVGRVRFTLVGDDIDELVFRAP